jgi:hypothetical protein
VDEPIIQALDPLRPRSSRRMIRTRRRQRRRASDAKLAGSNADSKFDAVLADE